MCYGKEMSHEHTEEERKQVKLQGTTYVSLAMYSQTFLQLILFLP